MEGCKMVEQPYLNQVGGKVNDDISTFDGGLNAYMDKAFLYANQMPYVMNMTMIKPPMVQTRTSRNTLAYYMQSRTLPQPDGDILEIWANDENDFFVITRNEVTTNLERYYRASPASDFEKTTVSTELPNDEPIFYFCYVPLDDYTYVYIGNEHFKCKFRFQSNNPLNTNFYIFQTEEELKHLGIPVWHKARLWLCRPSENTVEWSNSLQPDDFTIGEDAFAGELYITSGKGNLVNIASFDDKLLVLCEHSIHAIYGDSGDPSSSNFFQLVDLFNNIGLKSPKCLAIGGGGLFWLGDNYEVYEYDGASLEMVSRPNTNNKVRRYGGISSIITAENSFIYPNRAKMVATASKLYYNVGTTTNRFLFVYDIYNKVWWCEDGEFNTIANYSDASNRILMGLPNGDILVNYELYADGYDNVYDFDANQIVMKPIEYEFHTRVYGVEGVDLRKTLNDVWFQARAEADVYINDIWTSKDKWGDLMGDITTPIEKNYVKFGRLKEEQQMPNTELYRPEKYEQQACYVEKLYGQRLNAFQIIVKGKGASKFYLMKREWRAR